MTHTQADGESTAPQPASSPTAPRLDRRLTPGSVFVAPIPAGESPTLADGKMAVQPEPIDSPSAYILIADDHEDNRTVLTRRLEGRGHRVTAVGDGLKALDLARGRSFDLLLLDLEMPGLGGLQVLAHLKGDAATADLPVIMISAHDEIEKVVQAVKAGAEDYLPKPFEPTLLYARIGSSLSKKRAMDSQRKALADLSESQRALAAELAEAAHYVRGLLPEPLAGPVTATWHYLPSAQLGGDALGYQWVDDDHFAFYVLDVCGHGVAAALHSISVMNILKGRLLPGIDFNEPSQVLACLNRRFSMEANHGLYFTLWYGVYQKSTGRLKWANGGHPPPLLFTADGSKGTPLEVSGGPGIGILSDGPIAPSVARPSAGSTSVILSDGLIAPSVARPSAGSTLTDATWPTGERLITPGERLVLFSDGLYEIRRADDTIPEYDDFVKALTDLAAGGKLDHGQILNLMGGPGQVLEDDITLLTLTFN